MGPIDFEIQALLSERRAWEDSHKKYPTAGSPLQMMWWIDQKIEKLRQAKLKHALDADRIEVKDES